MPITVFGNSSNNSEHKIDTSLFVQKPFLRTVLIESNIKEDTEHIALNDRNITNARYIQVNQLPQMDSHLTAKLYIDNTIAEPTLVRNIQDNNFNI